MDVGFSEMVIIALAIVVLFGPGKIPEIARGLGEGIRKMRGAMEDIKQDIMKEADNPVSEIKREIDKAKSSLDEINPLNDLKNPLAELKDEINSLPKPAATNLPKQEAKPAPQDDDNHEGPVSR